MTFALISSSMLSVATALYIKRAPSFRLLISPTLTKSVNYKWSTLAPTREIHSVHTRLHSSHTFIRQTRKYRRRPAITQCHLLTVTLLVLFSLNARTRSFETTDGESHVRRLSEQRSRYPGGSCQRLWGDKLFGTNPTAQVLGCTQAMPH